MTTDVQANVTKTGVGIITLNREKALNSLSSSMVKVINETLQAWRVADDVHLVLLEGAGEKAFCAGGDIKELYHNGNNHVGRAKSSAFLELEYDTDQLISDYPKPVIALMDGIVMGGGVGLSYGADVRIVTEKTKWAMPETAISFFPDVGAAYFLNQVSGAIGMYLGLVGESIQAGDALAIGVADQYVQSEDLSKLRDELIHIEWREINDTLKSIAECVRKLSKPAPKSERLHQLAPHIKKHFSHSSLIKVMNSLREDSSSEAQTIYKKLQNRSPLSLHVTFAHLTNGRNLSSFNESLSNDKYVASRFMECSDFYEGVRCLLVNKGAEPSFKYQSIQEVPTETVRSFLEK
ncbi:enoyl-CoA hydratase/isomerase family protein [Alkalihalobacillus sp. NPDC078783]